MKIKNKEKEEIEKLVRLKSYDALKEIDDLIKTHNKRMNVNHLRVIKSEEPEQSNNEKKS